MIKEFQGEFRWLSNFTPCQIELDGLIFPSVEHAYMSAKSNDSSWKQFCTNPANTAGKIKKLSRDVKLIDNWEDIKVDIMKKCLIQKFNQEPFKSKLRFTRREEIQEGNTWNDVFWGVDINTGKGLNTLGKLIMEIREGL